MAEAALPGRREPARVARNDLSQPVHSSARSAETGTGEASSLPAADPPLAALQRSRALPRPDRRCHLHPGTTCGDRRSCHSRPLGGRSVARGAPQPRGHAGRPSFAVLHAGESARQGHGYRGGRPEPARATTPGDVAALADLGSRTRDGPTQELHHGYRCTGLLLGSAEPLAARRELKPLVVEAPARVSSPASGGADSWRHHAYRKSTFRRDGLGSAAASGAAAPDDDPEPSCRQDPLARAGGNGVPAAVLTARRSIYP